MICKKEKDKMTVGELKKALENIDESLTVCFEYDCGFAFGQVYYVDTSDVSDGYITLCEE